MEFNYRWTQVEVDYDLCDDDPHYHPQILIKSVYYLGVDIYPIMNEVDEIALKESMYDKLFR